MTSEGPALVQWHQWLTNTGALSWCTMRSGGGWGGIFSESFLTHKLPWDALSSDGRFVLAVAVVVKLEIPILIKRLVLLARPDCSGYFLRPPLLDDSSKTAIASDDKSTGAVEIFILAECYLYISHPPTYFCCCFNQLTLLTRCLINKTIAAFVQLSNNWIGYEGSN